MNVDLGVVELGDEGARVHSGLERTPNRFQHRSCRTSNARSSMMTDTDPQSLQTRIAICFWHRSVIATVGVRTGRLDTLQPTPYTLHHTPYTLLETSELWILATNARALSSVSTLVRQEQETSELFLECPPPHKIDNLLCSELTVNNRSTILKGC